MSNLDRNGDGAVNNTDEKLIELENSDRKQDIQRKLAVAAFISMVALMGYVLLGNVASERIEAMSNLIEMFYISMAGIIAAFFGADAFITTRK